MARLNPLRLEKETLLRLTAAAGAAVLGGAETQSCPGETLHCITTPYDTTISIGNNPRTNRPTSGISAIAYY